jgi:O-antigen/teichoic acid export membrane protein
VTTKTRNATRVVASNSFWYAFETLFGILMVFATSIPMARIIGPERLGYFNYVLWLTNIGTMVTIGIPSATHKYMAEYLGRGDVGLARTIFYKTFGLQALAATLVTGSGVAAAVIWGDPQYRAVSIVQILSMLPAMVNAVPSQANNAAENMRGNVAGSIVSSTVYLVGVVASLVLHWNLMGIASAFLLSRSLEFVVRVTPVMRRLSGHAAQPIPPDIIPAMRGYALKCIGLMGINLVVWDKSDVFLLKMLNHDLRQITFFSIAFNLTEKTLMLPQVFGHAMGVTMMAEYGRQKERVSLMAAAGAKYMYLIAAPLLFGMALVSGPLIRVLYGRQYMPAIPVLAVAAGLALFKPLLLPADYHFRAHNRPGPLLVWNSVCGAVNVGVDWALIPALGALGAGIGNGVAQMLAVAGIWAYGMKKVGMWMDFGALAKISVAMLAMAPPVLLINATLPPAAALATGVPAGAVAFLGALRWLKVLEPEDGSRLGHVARAVPGPLRMPLERLTALLIQPAAAAAGQADSAS